MASGGSEADGLDAGPTPDEVDGATVVPIEETLDLHSFAPQDVPDLVREYLAESARHGLREVRVIHGRGTGTQRAIVRSVLVGYPLVATFADAPPDRGGWGATIVRLRGDPNGAHDEQ
jgi:DNA-nicking Smr family endonuclease